MAEVDAGALAPVVPAVPASTDAPAPDATAAPVVEKPEGATEPVAKPERTFTQKEVNEIAARRAAQAERAALKVARAEVERDMLRQQLEQRDRPAQQRQGDGAPNPKDYNVYDDYLVARAKYEFKQEAAAEQKTRESETQAQQDQRQRVERARYVQENLISKGVAKFGDEFTEMVLGDDSLPITEVMVAAASRLPAGADVLMDLAKNPAELRRIAALPEIEQAWTIKDLESKVSAAPALTKMSAPITPNSTAARTDTGYRPDMTDKQFAEWRRRSKAQR